MNKETYAVLELVTLLAIFFTVGFGLGYMFGKSNKGNKKMTGGEVNERH